MGSTSRDEHLAAYRLVDIGLDPFPHGGGVSTWESLYMGVPVVTKLGHSLSTRIGGAIMSAIDMTDWIARDDEEYVDIALRSSADRLRAVREKLPELIAARCSPAAYTRAAEAAYRGMWERYCGGRWAASPQPNYLDKCARKYPLARRSPFRLFPWHR
jgi:predicted O-linked N-acetylglucosamine transferase (SPINDLY family)